MQSELRETRGTEQRGILLFLLCFCVCAAVSADKLDDVEKAAKEAWQKQNSIAADVSMTAALPMGEGRIVFQGKGQSLFLREGTKEMYKQTMVVSMPEPINSEIKNQIVFDGMDLYLTNETMGQAETLKDKPSIENGNVPPGGEMLFEVLREYMELKVEKEGNVGERAAHVISGSPKAQYRDRAGFVRAVFSIDEETGFLVRTELFDDADSSIATIESSNIQRDVVVNPADFVAPSSYNEEARPTIAPEGAP